MELLSSLLTKKQHNKQAEEFAQSVFGSFSEIMRVCGYERINDFAIIYGQSLNTTCESIMEVEKNIMELERVLDVNNTLLAQIKGELGETDDEIVKQTTIPTEDEVGEDLETFNDRNTQQENLDPLPEQKSTDIIDQLFE